MINFNVVEFSEHRSEEVINFFWCSVCNLQILGCMIIYYYSECQKKFVLLKSDTDYKKS